MSIKDILLILYIGIHAITFIFLMIYIFIQDTITNFIVNNKLCKAYINTIYFFAILYPLLSIINYRIYKIDSAPLFFSTLFYEVWLVFLYNMLNKNICRNDNQL